MKVILLLLALANSDPYQAGVRAFEEKDYPAALTAFTQAEAKAGANASAELLYNKALAALYADELRIAEIAAEKAAVRGKERFMALRDFLFGATAFRRSKLAEARAEKPYAKPSAFDLAVTHAEMARKNWILAAQSRVDWPQARRNVERALLQIKTLKHKKKAALEREKKKKKKQTAQPKNQALKDNNKDTEKARVKPQLSELAPEQVKDVLKKLKQKEKEKLKLRKAQQLKKRPKQEKDW